MGVGSGAVLTAMGQIGVARLCGVDIDPDALKATATLLDAAGLLDRTTLHLGSLWEPLDGERFDIIATNLPQFAAEEPADPEHTPYWSSAGQDGRKFMDPFLAGLGQHLRANGVAFVAHNVFLGLERTERILRSQGLACVSVGETSVLLHPRKAAMLNPGLRAMGPAVGIHRMGGYEFVDVRILRIGQA